MEHRAIRRQLERTAQSQHDDTPEGDYTERMGRPRRRDPPARHRRKRRGQSAGRARVARPRQERTRRYAQLLVRSVPRGGGLQHRSCDQHYQYRSGEKTTPQAQGESALTGGAIRRGQDGRFGM
jgi:hypothetical protein